MFQYMAISSVSVCPEPIPDRIQRLLNMGVPAIQIRDKQEPDRIRYEWISQIPPHSRDRLFVNGRADIAVLSGCAGVHLPTRGLSVADVKQVTGQSVIVGRSTHTLGEARIVEEEGVDYITFGPVFPTPSKPNRGPDQIPGLEKLQEVCKDISIPVLALGGIDSGERIARCREMGADGVAGIRLLFSSDDPKSVWKTVSEFLT